MVKSIVFATLSVIATSLSAGDPFTVFEGPSESAPRQPQACVSEDGVAHLTFGVGDQVFYCQVNGPSKLEPQVVFRIPNMSLGMRRGPRIAHSGKSIVITAIGGVEGKGKDGDILAYHSDDNGKTWIGPSRVNDVESSAREGLHAMTASSEGILWCVWLDLREKGTQIFASKSSDQGRTWSKNVHVYRSPDGSVCECCHPSIVATRNSLHVLFRNSINGNRDMYLVSSDDGGGTFKSAVRLGQSNWQLNACPMDGGMLALDRNQKLLTVWRRDRSVFSAEPESISEAFIGVGEQPWIANSSDGFYIVWTSKRSGDLLLLAPGSSNSERLGSDASYPIVTSAIRSESVVYAFWEKQSGKDFSILGKRLK
jgi:hypothetical protein